jgi:beta-lactamase class C
LKFAFLVAVAVAALVLPAAAEEFSPVAAPSSPGEESFRLSELEDAIDAAFETGDFVGLAVAVVRDGKPRLLKTWGVREAERDEKVTPSTVFRLASLSKGFAGTLAGMAMTEGLLSPTDPATRFAPTLKLAGGAEKSLQLGHMLSHQTGLPPNAYDNLLEEGASPADIYPKYAGVKLSCAVGACYGYQNIAFDVSGAAVSSAYGLPYATVVEEKLFRPLGMTTASVGYDGLFAGGDVALPHKRDRLSRKAEIYGDWRRIDVKKPYYSIPAAGGVNASILDMTRWLAAQTGDAPDVVSPAVLDLIHAPRTISPAETARMRTVSPRFRAAQYGFGWRLYNYGGAQVIAHAGTVDGYAAQIAFLPDSGVGIIILANARSRRLWRILPTFLDLELGLPREDWLEIKGDASVAAAGK